jgi:Icc protein
MLKNISYIMLLLMIVMISGIDKGNSQPRMRVAWLTDLHLNMAEEHEVNMLVAEIKKLHPEALFITGDIASGRDVGARLNKLYESTGCNIYFVLGNHDFYHSSIDIVRKEISALSNNQTGLVYLTQRDAVMLTRDTAIIGHDGLADGRAGSFFTSDVSDMINDYHYIRELSNMTQSKRYEVMNALGNQTENKIRSSLRSALAGHNRAVLLMHAPPFEEACMYDNKPGNPIWTCHFVCKAAGRAIIDVMKGLPDRELLVLCGNTHHKAEYSPLPNVRVLVGNAEYGKPSINMVLEIQ